MFSVPQNHMVAASVPIRERTCCVIRLCAKNQNSYHLLNIYSGLETMAWKKNTFPILQIRKLHFRPSEVACACNPSYS
jgi:hypothetical protein